MNLLATATEFLDAGLCTLPARLDLKCPSLDSWKPYQDELPEPRQLQAWFTNSSAICLVTGAVSRNLELIDFDFKAELFEHWKRLIEAESPGLLDRLVIETSQSGGRHVVYRCESVIPGNQKLAQKTIATDSLDPFEYRGKLIRPRAVGGKFEATITLIETRGEGGVFLCSPSPGYVLESGSLSSPPLLTEAEREILIEAALALNQVLPPVVNGPARQPERVRPTESQHGRPGDDYNERGDFRELLRSHRWMYVGGSDTELWRRPDKTIGHSATIRIFEGKPVLYVFSSNAAPFEPEKSYSPYAVYTLLEHSGDYTAAAKALGSQGYGSPARSSTRQSTGLTDDYFDSLQANCTEQYDLPSVEGNALAETEAKRLPNLKILTAGDLIRDFTQLRRMLIDGLLRDGEVMNVIAPPKLGKSWLVLSLVLAVACGIEWLGRFATRRGKVLLIDNELHPETLANRLPRVAMAMGLSPEDYGENVSVICLRGRLIDLKQLAFELMQIEPGSYDLIVFDAWYRLLPAGTDENANGDVTQLYNLLESVADRIGSAFTCIHHTSKGNQSEKNITDVGSGAGAQARAADTHMVMRPHEVDGAIVVGASVRSWAPLEPFVMRFEFPIFSIDEHLNPNDLKAVRRGKFKTTGLNDRSDPDDPARAQLMESLKSNLAGMSQSALRKATGFNGPKFLRLVQPLIDARLVEYIPKEDAGTKADIYRAAVGLVGLDPRQTQTNCTDTQTVCGLGLAPLGPDPDLDLVSGVGSAPTWDQFPNMDGDFRIKPARPAKRTTLFD